ncbi:MAG: hypothetical protein ACREBC_22035 [Pyrinomonadaceae bacterium]
MKVGAINFLEFLAGEEQNLLTSLVTMRQDFDVFNHLDELYRAPVGLIDVPKGEDMVPGLYLFVHFHLYVSFAALARSHLSECLASTRKAIDAALSGYEMMVDPDSIPLYKAHDSRFQFIKSYIAKVRKGDASRYPLAVDLVALHEICSEFGSHADVSSFAYRVEMKEADHPGKSTLLFHYFQFPRDNNEYHSYFVETLLAYQQILVIFQDFVASKALGLGEGWKDEIAKLGAVLEKERAACYAFFEAKSKSAGKAT